MATTAALRSVKIPLLKTGDRLKQPEFHRLYEQTPKHFRAELIGGTVYVSSPLRREHGSYHLCLGGAFLHYEAGTPGIEGGDNTTMIFDILTEPQPDLFLRILTEYGGQSKITLDDYIAGAPELLAEIALSSNDIDLGVKREQYQRAGVLEYVVVALRSRELFWFDFRANRLLKPDARGVFRSRVFPGLWIDGPALLARRSGRLLEVVELGLASPEHARFVKRLESRFRKGGA